MLYVVIPISLYPVFPVSQLCHCSSPHLGTSSLDVGAVLDCAPRTGFAWLFPSTLYVRACRPITLKLVNSRRRKLLPYPQPIFPIGIFLGHFLALSMFARSRTSLSGAGRGIYLWHGYMDLRYTTPYTMPIQGEEHM